MMNHENVYGGLNDRNYAYSTSQRPEDSMAELSIGMGGTIDNKKNTALKI